MKRRSKFLMIGFIMSMRIVCAQVEDVAYDQLVSNRLGYTYVTSVSLDQSEIRLFLGANSEFTLSATVKPDYATYKDVLWASSDSRVASVDRAGKVTAYSVGRVTITATSAENKAIYANCVVNVFVDGSASIPVSGISIDPPSLELKVGQDSTLKSIITPENATNKQVTWFTSNHLVAQVDAEGKVTALQPGIAYINARSVENSAILKASKVTVVEENTPGIPVEGIRVEGPANLCVGCSAIVTAILIPENVTDKAIEWFSSDDTVVKVDAVKAASQARITALRPGVAYINARLVEDRTILKALKVTVNEVAPKSLTIGEDLTLLSFYPNPVKDRLYINGTNEGEPVEIFALNGTAVMTAKAQEGQTIIECAHLTPGVYFLKTRGEVKKLIKK